MIIKSATALLLSALVVGFAAANGPVPQKASKSKAATCPVCGMALASKKSKADPVAVRLTKKGKVLYCCAGCKMPKSVLVHPAKK